VIVGLLTVGDVANTNEPEPVSSVTADAKFAAEGVAKNVATPVPRPLTPVAIGRPVALVRVADAGVPNAPPDWYLSVLRLVKLLSTSV
jgi:hypothetical protein